MKHYKTNYLTSVTFYFAFLCPVIMIILSIPLITDFKNSWAAALIFYPVAIFGEYLAIKYMRKDIIIDETGITITSANHIQKANWSSIVELKEYLFGQGELFYELVTKDKEKIGFSSSIRHCSDLLQEIESRTGLKFKQRL